MFANMLCRTSVLNRQCYRLLSSRIDNAYLEQKAAALLAEVVEPVTGRPLGSLGAVQSVRLDKGGVIKADIDLFVPGYVKQSQVVALCAAALKSLGPEVVDTKITVIPPRKFGSVASLESSTLSGVGHIIGVSSCKGGVGKSTVAVNLALTLAAKGLRIAILDADIYGPSLPHLLAAKDLIVRRSPTNPKHILPLESAHKNVKMLSFGHVNPKSGAPGSGGQSAAVVRGPIVSKIINQLLLNTEWGDVDYMIVDMPPGTGDIQITLTQSISLTGAVIVTTPHTLSLVDAAKGVAMFEELKVPTLAVVENMSHFTCEHRKRYYPFGRGGREKLLSGLGGGGGAAGGSVFSQQQLDTQWRLQKCPMQSIPLVIDEEDTEEVGPSVGVSNTVSSSSHVVSGSSGSRSGSSSCGDAHCSHEHHSHPNTPSSSTNDGDDNSGGPVVPLPIVLRDPAGESGAAYWRLADDVINEVFRSQAEAIMTPSVSYAEKKRALVLRYFTASHAEEFSVPVEELRLRDPLSGAILPSTKGKDRSSFAHLSVVKLDFKGKYGVSVVWSDGHYADIFPFHVLRQIAEELLKSQGAEPK